VILLYISLLLCICKKEIIKSSTYIIEHSSVTETAKYMRNAMLAVRVGVCNEFESFCNTQNIDYESVRQLVISDPRIGPAHTKVPGPRCQKRIWRDMFTKRSKSDYNRNDGIWCNTYDFDGMF